MASSSDTIDTSAVSLPTSFLCPLSHDVMKNPVKISSGQVYDRLSIQDWFSRGHTTCPITGLRLSSKDLTSVPSVKCAIDEFLSMFPDAVSKQATEELEVELGKHKDERHMLGDRERKAWRRLISKVIKKGNVYVLQGLSEASTHEAIDVITSDPWYMMRMAVSSGHADMVASLAELGLPVDTTDSTGSTLTHVAAERGYAEVIRVLGHFSAPLHMEDKNGITPAQVAVAKHFCEVVEALNLLGVPIATLRIALRACTLMHVAAIYSNVTTISKLVSLGVSLDAPDQFGCVPVELATLFGRVSELERMGALGANFHQPVHQILAHSAIMSNNPKDILQVLDRFGYPLDTLMPWPAVQETGLLFRYHPDQGMRKACEIYKVNARCFEVGKSFTPAHLAATLNNTDALKALHTLRCPLSTAATSGGTPAHYAAAKGNIEVLNVLKTLGVQLDCQDDNCKTPTDWAVSSTGR